MERNVAVAGTAMQRHLAPAEATLEYAGQVVG
jgi:hypothetical protein